MAEAVGALARLPGLLNVRSLRRLAVALVLALPLFWQLGGAPLFDVDEGAFSEATREMMADHEWGHTTLNGAPRFDKPIATYWAQAAAVRAFGLNEFALRLPSALACWAMALALAAFAARRWGSRAGVLAGVITVTSLGPQVIGRAATADGLLNLLLVLTCLDAWRFVEDGKRSSLRRAYAWTGVGLLVKGPIALLVPGAAFLLWCAASRRWQVLRAALADAWGWALLLLIAAPWYAYALHRDGMDFVDGFLLHHNVLRFTGTVGGHAGSPLYYVLVLPLLAMPWAPLLFAVAARARALWREPLARYLLAWSGFVLVFFSFGATKLPHYGLYGYAPLVLLMARLLGDVSRPWRIAVSACLVLWAVVIAALPALVLHFAPAVHDPFYGALLAGAPAPAWWPAVLGVALVAAPACWPLAGGRAWRGSAAAGLALSLLVAGWGVPWVGEALQGPVRRAAAFAEVHGGEVVQWEVHLPSFALYLGRPVPIREPQAQVMVLTRPDRQPADAAQRPKLFNERGVLLLGPRAH